MKQRTNPNITKMFPGFRLVRKKMNNKIQAVPVMSKRYLTKSLLKKFEKLEALTQIQGKLVKEQLEKCTENSYPPYIARLDALLEKVEPKLEVENNEKESKQN